MGPKIREGGFTLVEVLVALLLLSIVMVALVPVFWSTLRATTNSNQRSVANSLAVTASEQMRAFPYYEVGYYASDAPSGCSGLSSLDQVKLADPPTVPSEPLAALPTVDPVGGTSYTTLRCVYWVSASDGKTDAYKESLVQVSWKGQTGAQSVTLTSSLYPGGQTGYSAQNDLLPTGAPSSNCTGTAPGIPQNVVATPDSPASNDDTIVVSWSASSPAADYYEVVYTDYAPPTGAIDQTMTPDEYQISPETSATTAAITVTPGNPGPTYYFQVEAVACGMASAASQTASAAYTASASGGSTTNPGGCTIGALTTNPSSTPTNEVAVSSGSLQDTGNNKISITGTITGGTCTNVVVAWAPTGCPPGRTGCGTTYTPMSDHNGTLSATVGGNGAGGATWAAPATLQFVLYFGSGPPYVAYSPTTAANILTCVYVRGSSCT